MLDCCEAECSKYAKCSNLTGFCCPTTDKEMLDCCKGLDLGFSELSLPTTNALGVSVKDPVSCSSHSKCAAAGLSGACCPSTDGQMLGCCEAECSKNAKCSHLEGFCCPTIDKVMLDCCSGNSSVLALGTSFMTSEKLPPREEKFEDPASCSSHSKCVAAGLSGSCCPSKAGQMLDCCEAECSKHTKCMHLTGFCCPTTDKVMLACCDGNSSAVLPLEPLLVGAEIVASITQDRKLEDPASCSSHDECAAAGLSGLCCPNEEGRMLECCQAECSKHAKCAHLKGLCCPTTDKVMLDCCSGNTSAAIFTV